MSEADAKRAEIEALIPHREPFLLVDELLSHDVEAGRLSAAWTLSPDLECYRGHYPGRPVTPGALLCEHAFQAGALLVSLSLSGFAAEDGVPVLTRIRDARFKRIVLPGERVETEVVVADRLGPVWDMKAVVRCEGAVAVKVAYALSATEAMARVGTSGTGGRA